MRRAPPHSRPHAAGIQRYQDAVRQLVRDDSCRAACALMRGEKREEKTMLIPKHEILSAQSGGMSARRAGIIGGVALLHVAAVYVLITGMAGKIVKALPGDITVRSEERRVG